MSEGRMRRIAADWHNGMNDPLYSFVSTGAISDAVREEVEQTLVHEVDVEVDGETAIDELQELYDYLVEASDRGAQEGWHRIWE